MRKIPLLILVCLYIPAVFAESPEKARAYPTIFDPGKEAIKIRYILNKDSDVTVRVYTAVMDPVYEIRFSAGERGASEGINIVEWDGSGGEEKLTGRSGAYHILIDKGYEKEWTGAVIKNY